MPATTHYSAVLAIHTLWLAARSHGLGLGWISILDPAELATTLQTPAHWQFIAYLCLGHPAEPNDTPELERAGWEHRHPPQILNR